MTKDTLRQQNGGSIRSITEVLSLMRAIHDLAGLRHIFGAVECVQAFGKPQKEDFNPFVSVNTNILFKNGL
jgi:hypothetical protein